MRDRCRSTRKVVLEAHHVDALEFRQGLIMQASRKRPDSPPNGIVSTRNRNVEPDGGQPHDEIHPVTPLTERALKSPEIGQRRLTSHLVQTGSRGARDESFMKIRCNDAHVFKQRRMPTSQRATSRCAPFRCRPVADYLQDLEFTTDLLHQHGAPPMRPPRSSTDSPPPELREARRTSRSDN